MNRYTIENNKLIFYRIKVQVKLNDQLDYLYFKTEQEAKNKGYSDFDLVSLTPDEIFWEGLKVNSTKLVNIIFKSSMYSNQECINELFNLLNSNEWEYGSWKLDKIKEYELLGLENPYEAELKNLHNYREYVRNLINYYLKN